MPFGVLPGVVSSPYFQSHRSVIATQLLCKSFCKCNVYVFISPKPPNGWGGLAEIGRISFEDRGYETPNELIMLTELMETLSKSANRVIISRNPNSGATDRAAMVEELKCVLEEHQLIAEVLTDIEDVKQKTNDYLASNSLRAVVAAGGDGTVSLLANELPAEVPLAILPLGTENLLAKYLRLTAKPNLIAELIAQGNTVRIDAGRANGKLFLVMASCGFDAEVVAELHANRKGHIHHWSYAWPIWNSIRQYRYPTIRVYLENRPKPVAAKWAFIFNVPRYAMNLPIVHDADSMDGQLDVCTFGRGKLIRGLIYLAAVVTRQHRWKKDRVHRARKLRIESDEAVSFQLDGDPGGQLPVEIEVVPKFLRLIVDGSWKS